LNTTDLEVKSKNNTSMKLQNPQTTQLHITNETLQGGEQN